MRGLEGAWTITELAERAGAALAGDPVRVNGRVRELPNERLIRWYTTIGLVDPPLARRGRTALYGPRHLLQLVAVKRRQAAGLAIAQIQAELTGATDDMLRDLARLPDTASPDTGPPDTVPLDTVPLDAATSVRRPRPRERFWAEPPAADRPARQPGRADGNPGRGAPATVVPGIRLAAGVTLLIDGGARPIADADLGAIEAAARPLLDELRRRGLRPEQVKSGTVPAADQPGTNQPGTEPSPDSTEPVPPTSPGRRSS